MSPAKYRIFKALSLTLSVKLHWGLVNKSRTGHDLLGEPCLGSWDQECLSGLASGTWNGGEFRS